MARPSRLWSSLPAGLKGRRLLPLLALLAVTLFCCTSPALADLRVCNKTGDPVSVALGYRADRGWQSEGWWVAQPAQCATVFQGNLNSRFFYLFAADDIGGGAWDGDVYMCTRDDSFTIFGVEDCLARGYERTGFFEVDTKNKTDWTLELTDPKASAPGTDADGPGNGIGSGAGTTDDGGNPNPDATDPGAAPASGSNIDTD